MGKKSSRIGLYFVGMAMVVVGFILPIFKVGAIGSANGFDLVGKGDSLYKVAALLVFVGAVAGVVLSLIGGSSFLRLVVMLVSIIGGAYIILNVGNLGNHGVFGKLGLKLIGKTLYVGFYVIVVGWVISLLGYFTEK